MAPTYITSQDIINKIVDYNYRNLINKSTQTNTRYDFINTPTNSPIKESPPVTPIKSTIKYQTIR